MAWRNPCSRSRADSRSSRPPSRAIRRWPSARRCSVAATAPPTLSASTVGMSAGPVCGSTATTGTSADADTTVGVTRMAPSMRVPPRRLSERRSQPDRTAVVPTGVREQLVARLVDGAGHALEQLGAERLELGDEHPDDVRAVAAQAAGPEAGLVAERLDDLGDPVDGALGDAVALVDDLGDRGDRHAGLACDVLHPHAADGRHGPRLPGRRRAAPEVRNRCRIRFGRTLAARPDQPTRCSTASWFSRTKP